MISLDTVLLLEQKVESAVAKIAQLQAENDALRSKCSELTNALSAKSEQFSSFETEQNKIESGILKALDRLNSIENSVLKAAGQVSPTPAPQTPVQQAPVQQNPVQNNPVQNNPVQQAPVQAEPVHNETVQSQPVNQTSFFDLNQTPVQPEAQDDFSLEGEPEESEPENGQFDIF